MTVMAMSIARWEYQMLRTREEHSTGARQAWPACLFQRATRPAPFKDRSLAETTTLKRLVNAPGYMGA